MDKINSEEHSVNLVNNDTSKQLKNNNSKKVNDVLISDKNSSIKTNLILEQIKSSNKEDNKFLTSDLCGISSTLNKNKNSEEIINNSFNSKEGVQKDKYAIEDQISISEYDKIKNPARTFDFPLDDFQKRSIIRLEQNHNILVCAHTSSGKTLVIKKLFTLLQ